MTKNKISFHRNLLTALCFCLLSAQIFIVNALSVCAQVTCGPAIGIPCNPVSGKISNLTDAVIVVTLYLLSIIGLIALLFIVFAGVKYMFSAGDEEKMKSAKNAFHSAIFGLSVALLAYGILSVIDYILNG
jgi:heme/copper-type cytochrome/quinol oxidase subunit 2